MGVVVETEGGVVVVVTAGVIMMAAAAAVVVVVTTAATVVTTVVVVLCAGVVVWCGVSGRVGDSSALGRYVAPDSEDGVGQKSKTMSDTKGMRKRVERRKRAEEVERRCGMWSAARSLIR